METLKKENEELKRRMGSLETEDKHTQFQVNNLEDKVDRLDTNSKKKKFLIEGIREVEGRKEDIPRTVQDVLDQLTTPDSINYEACYRVGPFNTNHFRPIMVCFEKQADQDSVYTRRMELKATRDWTSPPTPPDKPKKSAN